jgi:hypothetical protein
MAWFQLSDGRLRYRGRMTRRHFTVWTSTKDGQAALDLAAKEVGFRVFARWRTSRHIWRELDRAARTEPLLGAIQAQADQFMSAFSDLAYAPALPRLQFALRRLVVVPRTMIGARVQTALMARLQAAGALRHLPEPVQTFFCDQLLREMDAAVFRAKPSPKSPVRARDEWVCVGMDDGFIWVDPLWCGPDRLGHVMMFEMPRDGLSRRQRKELVAAIAQLDTELQSLSRVERDAVVRAASAGVKSPAVFQGASAVGGRTPAAGLAAASAAARYIS